MRATSVIFCSLIIMVFVLGSITFAQQSASGPRIALSEPAFDFKEVAEGSTLEHVFRVSNKGDKVLEIKGVRPSRGCTVVRYDRTIPPGGEGKIILRMETEGYEGVLRKSGVVYSDDPNHPRVTLVLMAQIKASISVEPRGVVLKGFKGDDISGVVTIRAHEERPLTLEPVPSPPVKVAYELKTVKEGRVYQVVVRNISRKEGKYSGFLTLKTNYPEKPEIKIRFVGHITGVLQLEPETIHFGPQRNLRSRSPQGNTSIYQQSVILTLNRGSNLKVEKIEINRKIFTVDVNETEPGRSYRIDVRLQREKLQNTILNEKMEIHTNLKEHGVKIVPIRVEIK